MSVLESIGRAIVGRQADAAASYRAALEAAVNAPASKADVFAASVIKAADAAGVSSDRIAGDLENVATIIAANQLPVTTSDSLELAGKARDAIAVIDASEAAEIERVKAHFAGQRAPIARIASVAAGLHSASTAAAQRIEHAERRLAGQNAPEIPCGSEAEIVSVLDGARRRLDSAKQSDGLERIAGAWAAVATVASAIAHGATGEQATDAARLGREAREIAESFDLASYAPAPPTEPETATASVGSMSDFGVTIG